MMDLESSKMGYLCVILLLDTLDGVIIYHTHVLILQKLEGHRPSSFEDGSRYVVRSLHLHRRTRLYW